MVRLISEYILNIKRESWVFRRGIITAKEKMKQTPSASGEEQVQAEASSDTPSTVQPSEEVSGTETLHRSSESDSLPSLDDLWRLSMLDTRNETLAGSSQGIQRFCQRDNVVQRYQAVHRGGDRLLQARQPRIRNGRLRGPLNCQAPRRPTSNSVQPPRDVTPPLNAGIRQGGTEDVIEMCTVSCKFEQKVAKSIGDSGNENCAICLLQFEDKQDVRILRCSHVFHQVCVDTWLTTKSNCPICRREITDL